MNSLPDISALIRAALDHPPAADPDPGEPIPVDRPEISADGDRPAPAPEPCRPPAGIPDGKASGASTATVDEISADDATVEPSPAAVGTCGDCRALGSRDGRPWCFAVVIFDAKPDRGKPVSMVGFGCKRFFPRPD